MPEESYFRGTSVYSLSGQGSVLPDDSPIELKDGEEYQVEIELFREGKFKHWAYGDLDFDLDYLNKIIKNHATNVASTDVSFDVDHKPSSKGAVAWLSKEPGALFARRKVIQTPAGEQIRHVLVGKVNLNKVGYSLVKNKSYRYFSAEIAPVYRGKEVTTQIVDGKEVESQFSLNEPVLVSGGLTNRPFIPDLAPITLSESTVGTQTLGNGKQTIDIDSESGIHYFSFSTGKEPIVEDNGQIDTAKDNELFNEQAQGDNMLLNELINKLNAVEGDEAQLAYLQANASQFSEGTESIVFNALVQARENAVTQTRIADEAIRKQNQAEAQAKQFSDKNIELEIRVKEAREQNYSSRSQAFCESLTAQNFPIGVVDVVKSQLTSLQTKGRDHKFSLERDGSTREADLIELLTEVFSAFPEDMKVDLTEVTQAGASTEITPDAPVELSDEPADAPAVPANVQLYADKYMDGDASAVDVEMYDFIKADGDLDFTRLG